MNQNQTFRERQIRVIPASEPRPKEKQPPRPFAGRALVEDYKIVSAADPQELAAMVKAGFADGLQPYGVPVVIGDQICQCVVHWMATCGKGEKK